MEKYLQNLLRKKKDSKMQINKDKDKSYCFYQFIGGIEQTQTATNYRPKSKICTTRKSTKLARSKKSKYHLHHLSLDSIIQKRQLYNDNKTWQKNFCLVSKKITVKNSPNKQLLPKKQEQKYILNNPLHIFGNFPLQNQTMKLLKNSLKENEAESSITNLMTSRDDQYLISKLRNNIESKAGTYGRRIVWQKSQLQKQNRPNESGMYGKVLAKQIRHNVKNWDIISCRASRVQTPVFYL